MAMKKNKKDDDGMPVVSHVGNKHETEQQHNNEAKKKEKRDTQRDDILRGIRESHLLWR